ncbi:MAG: SusC/RagA family TonB-linked outer membrane protein, partial [Prevotella sp.]|nr:SusC/RagA family TonB-linked outer membrane protein [Prevotella sp.]
TSDEYSGIQHLFYEGRPQNSIYAVRSLGIDPSTGKEIFLDKDGNITDTWNAKDKVYLGSADPKFRGNLNSMFRWKDLTFNISFNYYWGGKTYNSTLRDRVEVTSTYLRSYNADKRVLESRWYNAGDVAFFSKIQSEQTKATSRYVMNDNVLELSSISLQYKLHNAWLMRNCGMQSAVFAVNMNDLAHWGSIKMERGTSYPYSRNIQFSLKLMF